MNGLTFVEGGEPQDLLDTRAPSYIDYFWVGHSLCMHTVMIMHQRYMLVTVWAVCLLFEVVVEIVGCNIG